MAVLTNDGSYAAHCLELRPGIEVMKRQPDPHHIGSRGAGRERLHEIAFLEDHGTAQSSQPLASEVESGAREIDPVIGGYCAAFESACDHVGIAAGYIKESERAS